MHGRRIAFIAAAACAAAFTGVMVWGEVIEQPRLAGDEICLPDRAMASLFGGDGPGVYRFDRNTGRPARIPASRALAIVFLGISRPVYPTQAKCGMDALTQTAEGPIAIGLLLGCVVALLIGLVTGARKARPIVVSAVTVWLLGSFATFCGEAETQQGGSTSKPAPPGDSAPSRR